jgi:hypothetical protein
MRTGLKHIANPGDRSPDDVSGFDTALAELLDG